MIWYIVEFVVTAVVFYLIGSNNPVKSVVDKITAQAKADLITAQANLTTAAKKV